MKFDFRKAILLITGVMAVGQLFAQSQDSTNIAADSVKPFSKTSAFRTWSIGAGVGVLTTYTIFGSNRQQDFTSPDGGLGYNIYIKDQILPSFGLQLDYFGGKLKADIAQPDASGVSPYAKFDTKLNYAINLSGNITLANINWQYQKGCIQPYVTFGGGFMGYKPVLHLPDGSVRDFKPGNGGNLVDFYFPLGLGLKFNLSPNINLDIGYQVDFANTDNLDGYDHGTTFDRFSYTHIGLEFALGSRSKPQLATHNPVSAMRTEYLIEEQKFQNTLQAQQTEINAEKTKNEQLREDLNKTNANLAKFTIDSDGDGVADFFDKCPNTPPGTKVDGSGCPLPVNKPEVKVYVTEQDKRVIKDAIKNLEFDSGKATIREHSFPTLDKVAQLLIDKNFSLKLAGHTDNVGSDDMNMKMSKDRAEAIKAYLVSKGVNASRIEATGYGKNQPIASNKTAKGRQLNRRVEFTLF